MLIWGLGLKIAGELTGDNLQPHPEKGTGESGLTAPAASGSGVVATDG